MNALRLAPFLGFLLMTTASHLHADPEPDARSSRLLTDFGPASADLGWYVVNDNVMGGRSRGGFQLEQQTLRFAGRTNTNGGGFSSIRTRRLQLELSKYDGIRVRIKGDGRRYTWRLTTNAQWRGRTISYWAEFDTQKGAWSEARIPFSDFQPKFRGYQLDGPALDPKRITGMGLMIYDKQDGPFELYLDEVSAYGARTPFSLAQYRSKKRVLVVSAAAENDADLRLQRADLEATRKAFEERDMVLVVALTAAGSRAGDRQLTAEEVAAVRASAKVDPGAFAIRLIGKDGSVKYRSAGQTPMSELYELIDAMPTRRAELRERNPR